MSLRSKIDSGAPDREVKHKAQQRAREAALRAALVKLEGEPIVIKGADAPAPAVPEPQGDLSGEERSAVLTRQSMPVTVREIKAEPAYMRNGVQWRPKTTREAEQEMNDRLDAQAIGNWNAYCDKVQADIDLSEAYERQRQQRESRERRTGVRPLPSSKDRTISLHEAMRLGYIGNSDDE